MTRIIKDVETRGWSGKQRCGRGRWTGSPWIFGGSFVGVVGILLLLVVLAYPSMIRYVTHSKVYRMGGNTMGFFGNSSTENPYWKFLENEVGHLAGRVETFELPFVPATDSDFPYLDRFPELAYFDAPFSDFSDEHLASMIRKMKAPRRLDLRGTFADEQTAEALLARPELSCRILLEYSAMSAERIQRVRDGLPEAKIYATAPASASLREDVQRLKGSVRPSEGHLTVYIDEFTSLDPVAREAVRRMPTEYETVELMIAGTLEQGLGKEILEGKRVRVLEIAASIEDDSWVNMDVGLQEVVMDDFFASRDLQSTFSKPPTHSLPDSVTKLTVRHGVGSDWMLALLTGSAVTELDLSSRKISALAKTAEGRLVLSRMTSLSIQESKDGLGFLEHCPKVETLTLEGFAEVTPAAMQALAELENVEEISLECDQLPETFQSLATCPRLKKLSVYSEESDLQALATLGDVTRLETLELCLGESMSDQFLEFLPKLPRLENLHVEGVGLSPGCVTHLSGCRSLRRFTYDDLDSDIPQALYQKRPDLEIEKVDLFSSFEFF